MLKEKIAEFVSKLTELSKEYGIVVTNDYDFATLEPLPEGFKEYVMPREDDGETLSMWELLFQLGGEKS